MNVNKVFLMGRLTVDPQLKSTPSGMQVTSFGLATNRVWYDKNTSEKKESTQFHNIVAWGKTAEVASKFLKKGSMCFIEGRLESRSWDTPTGEKRRTVEIIAETLQLPPRSMSGGDGVVATGGNNFSYGAKNTVNSENGTSNNSDEVKTSAPQSKKEEVPVIDFGDDIGEINFDDFGSDIKPEDLPF